MRLKNIILGVLFLILLGANVSAEKMKKSEVIEMNKKRAMELFIEGRSAEAKEDYADAITSYLEALEYDPESGEIALAIAKAFIGNDQKILSALRYAELAVQLSPKNADAWGFLQRLEQHVGRIDLAVKSLEKYIALKKTEDFMDIVNLSWYYFDLGQDKKAKELLFSRLAKGNIPAGEMEDAASLLASKGYIDDAVLIYKQVIERDPLDVENWLLLGQTYEKNNQNAKALETYKAGIRNNQDSVHLLVAAGNLCLSENDWESAAKYFENALNTGVESDKLMKTLSAVYFYSGKDSLAVSLVDSLKAQDKDDAELYFSLGKAMNYLSRFEDAEKYFRQGLEKDHTKLPDEQRLNAYRNFASTLINLKKYEDTLAFIKQVSESDINDKVGVKLLESAVYLEMKRYDDAAAIYEWLISSDPNNTGYIIGLGRIYTQAKEYDKAIEVLNEVKKVDPDNMAYLFQLSLVYDMSGNKDKAEEALLKILKKQSDNDLALNNLAYLYIENDKNIKKAVDMVKKALEMDPQNGAYFDTLGWGLFKLGKFDEAKKNTEEALKLEATPDRGVIYHHYGDIMMKLGNTDAAREAYEKAIGLGEDSDKIQPKIDSIKSK